MRVEVLKESKPAVLSLSETEAIALSKAGRRLASSKIWWGESGEEKVDRSVIRCLPESAGKWRVTVQDAVGIVSVGQLQLVVQPKIPQSHLLYLLEKGNHLPRIDDERGYAGSGQSLWQLVANWFVKATEDVLRRDLLRDYSEQADFLSSKRGRVVALPTARAFYSGRMGFDCEFEEFTVDTPANRVIKAAAITVLGSRNLPRNLRRRAQAIRLRMDSVGEIVHDDLRVNLDRRSAYYSDAIQLARHILRSQGRVLAAGNLSAWTFLIRTPEMIEDGLRNILIDGIGRHMPVEKRGIKTAAGITFNPDLVFYGGRAVADVKYKILKKDWMRSDLYQIIAFGTAFKSQCCSIFGFVEDSPNNLPKSFDIGGLHVSCLGWHLGPESSPEDSANRFISQVTKWLDGFIDTQKVELVRPS